MTIPGDRLYVVNTEEELQWIYIWSATRFPWKQCVRLSPGTSVNFVWVIAYFTHTSFMLVLIFTSVRSSVWRAGSNRTRGATGFVTYMLVALDRSHFSFTHTKNTAAYEHRLKRAREPNCWIRYNAVIGKPCSERSNNYLTGHSVRLQSIGMFRKITFNTCATHIML